MFMFIFDTDTKDKNIVLDENQAKFLVKFIELYWGNFIKWRLKKQNGEISKETEEVVTQYILNILRNLGDEMRIRSKTDSYCDPNNIFEYIE